LNNFPFIKVAPGRPVQIIENSMNYPLIGKGLQGAVFKLNNQQCVKVYSRMTFCKREKRAYENVNASLIFPRIYETGRNYIILEYIDGPSVEEHLITNKSITETLAEKLLHVIEEMERLNFPRVDFSLRHCLFDIEGNLKLIDLVNSFKVNRKVPTRLFKDLKRLGLLNAFLDYIRKLRPEYYQKWLICRDN
jgi:RIO-like serine/threonine protein kinase